MSVLGIRNRLKTGLKKVLRAEVPPPPPPTSRASELLNADADYEEDAAPSHVPPPGVSLEAAAAKQGGNANPSATEAKAAKPKAAEPEAAGPSAADAEAAPPASKMHPDDDTVGAAITLEAVEEILNDMVRPALRSDGGDITLIKVEDNDIYVRLVGACSTCPSSIMTMKMGVEALLKEEFPTLRDVIQVS